MSLSQQNASLNVITKNPGVTPKGLLLYLLNGHYQICIYLILEMFNELWKELGFLWEQGSPT